jgi:carbonic anhydrase
LHFRLGIFPENKEIYESLEEKQKPVALFLTCGDSRIDPSTLTGTDPGQIFVERNPGNIVPIYDESVSVGVSASIEYAVAVLGVRDIIVCGHSACGAMKGLLHHETLEKIPSTARWLQYAQPAVELLERNDSSTNETERLRLLTHLNVLQQMKHLHTHPAIEEPFAAGELGIHGWFYEIHTGTVYAYNHTTAKFELWPEISDILASS